MSAIDILTAAGAVVMANSEENETLAIALLANAFVNAGVDTLAPISTERLHELVRESLSVEEFLGVGT